MTSKMITISTGLLKSVKLHCKCNVYVMYMFVFTFTMSFNRDAYQAEKINIGLTLTRILRVAPPRLQKNEWIVQLFFLSDF